MVIRVHAWLLYQGDCYIRVFQVGQCTGFYIWWFKGCGSLCLLYIPTMDRVADPYIAYKLSLRVCHFITVRGHGPYSYINNRIIGHGTFRYTSHGISECHNLWDAYHKVCLWSKVASWYIYTCVPYQYKCKEICNFIINRDQNNKSRETLIPNSVH